MRSYNFTLKLRGCGQDVDEAFQYVLDKFTIDPGSVIIDEVVFENADEPGSIDECIGRLNQLMTAIDE